MVAYRTSDSPKDSHNGEELQAGKVKGQSVSIDIKTTNDQASENALALQTIMRQLLEKNDLVLIDKRQSAPKQHVNPGPLGLLGFGMTTVLLNFHNAGAYELGSVIPAMGLAMGGGLQLLAGILEFFNGKTFPATAFMSYGAFWLSLVALWLLPQEDHPHVVPTTNSFIAVYMLLWALYTLCMTVVTFFKAHVMLRVLFSSLTVLFLLLSIGNFTKNSTVLKVAGYEGIICGSVSLYIAFAEILADNLGRDILPLFP